MLVKDYSLSVPLKQNALVPQSISGSVVSAANKPNTEEPGTAHGGIDCSLVIELFFYFSDNGVLREDTRFEVID